MLEQKSSIPRIPTKRTLLTVRVLQQCANEFALPKVVGAAFRSVTMEATHETMTGGPEEVGISICLLDAVVKGITVEGNLNWSKEGRRLEESKLVQGVGIHGNWITSLEQTGEGFIPSRTTNPNTEGGLIIQSEDNIKEYSQEHNRTTLPLDENNKP